MSRLSQDEYDQLRKNLEERYRKKISKRRVKAIRVNSSYRWQPPLYIEIGKSCANLTQDGPLEHVVVIYESNSFLVCTLENGVAGGRPHVLWRGDVKEVVYDD
ncbi:MAG: hypothetical protein J7J98_05430 [candidate division Zixibacteria bacterium]|nr:hypothetical protein [candidate division Zixibacteria bacterium]